MNATTRDHTTDITEPPARSWNVGDQIAGRGIVLEHTVHGDLVEVVFSSGRRLLVVDTEAL